jgi:methyl-accepting chemotaxis protein
MTIVGHTVFEWVIAVAVLLVFVTNLILLWRISETLKGLKANAQALNDKLGPLVGEAREVVAHAREMISVLSGEVRPMVRAIATTTNDVSDLVHIQAIELRALMRDTVLVVRNKVEQLDDLVTRTTERVDETTAIIQRQVIEPVRELHYLIAAVKRALSVLFSRAKKSPDQAFQDEELFI